jgi:hypothetical protein
VKSSAEFRHRCSICVSERSLSIFFVWVVILFLLGVTIVGGTVADFVLPSFLLRVCRSPSTSFYPPPELGGLVVGLYAFVRCLSYVVV